MSKAWLALAAATTGLLLAGCGQARLANGQPCVPTNELGQIIEDPLPTNAGPQVLNVWPGDTVTVRLAFGIGRFPWTTPRSSNSAVLQPIAVCPFPRYTTTAEIHLTSFKTVRPGRATITAPLDPAYENSPPTPGTPRFLPLVAIVNVSPEWVPWAVRIGIAAIVLMVIAGVVIFYLRWPLPTPKPRGA